MENEKKEEKTYHLNTIYFYLTEGCNLACRHCWIAPHYQTAEHKYPALDLELFRSILRQAKTMNLSGVKLTGGEPLLHPQILDIIEIIRAEDLRLTMETNGVLCTPEIAKEISLGKNAFVSVSIDSTDPEIHEWIRGVKGSFEMAIEGVRNLVRYKLRPQIIMTIMRRNKDQIEPIVRLAEALGAGSVKYNILQPTARGETMHEQGETLSIEELIKIGSWVENELSKTTNLNLIYSHPIAFRPFSNIFGKGSDGCGVCGIFGIIGVLANGSYALCGIGETVSELVFGHASTDRLEDVWKNNKILNEIRSGLPRQLEGICNECVMKNICLGNCIAQNYYSNKSLWAPYWYCKEAKEKGLFPETRIRK
ncbi:TPA: SynChlorMet cassette radical SAM/SPASM protein ScmF [bacterium]|jgi:SynChlorMet cassette radical SAM/SPASM protein ScmF|nr:SynChlorMet cassette radical SAM/SPASM protein ScmF [bacterium]